MELSHLDQQLIHIAQETLKKIIVPEKHFVLSAIRAQSGKIYTGFNLKTTATRASICAESVALAQAIQANESSLDTLVTLAYPDSNSALDPAIVSPCGICRELLHDYASRIQVIVMNGNGPVKLPANDLLNFPYRRQR